MESYTCAMNATTLPLPPPLPNTILHSEDIGWLTIVSGKVLVADPFQGLQRRGNLALNIPNGKYRVVRTLLDKSSDTNHTAFLSLVLDEALLARRHRWQISKILSGEKDNLPPMAILEAGENEHEDDILLNVMSTSGCISLADPEIFDSSMPSDSEVEGESWYDVLFEHGVKGSWFDEMDKWDNPGPGAALISLPYGGEDSVIAIAQGRIGPKRIWWEKAFHQPLIPEETSQEEDILIELIMRNQSLIALHIDMSS